MRWKPTVTPIAVSTYIATMIAIWVQLTQSFHRNTIAASTPMNGTTTPARLALRSRRVMPLGVRSGLRSAAGGCGAAGGAGWGGRAVVVMLGELQQFRAGSCWYRTCVDDGICAIRTSLPYRALEYQ